MDKFLAQGLFEISSAALHRVGEQVELANGDCFRYVLAGASNLAAGKVALTPAATAEHVNETGANIVGAIGAREVTLNVAASAVAANQYAGGYLVVNDATGEGYTYRIDSNDAIASSGSGNFRLADPIQVALVASTSEITLVSNGWYKVVEAASSVRKASGVSIRAITAANYGWQKTKGACGVLIGSAATSGARLMPDGSTAGAVTDNTDVTTVQTEVIVALASYGAGVSTEYNPVELIID